MKNRSYSVRLQDQTLTDQIQRSPVDEYLARKRWRFRVVLLLIVVAIGAWLSWRFLVSRPATDVAIEGRSKYGSPGPGAWQESSREDAP